MSTVYDVSLNNLTYGELKEIAFPVQVGDDTYQLHFEWFDDDIEEQYNFIANSIKLFRDTHPLQDPSTGEIIREYDVIEYMNNFDGVTPPPLKMINTSLEQLQQHKILIDGLASILNEYDDTRYWYLTLTTDTEARYTLKCRPGSYLDIYETFTRITLESDLDRIGRYDLRRISLTCEVNK